MVLGLGGSIGHAYVEVSVRGDGMDHDVRRILNDAVDDADLQSVGRKASKDFTEGFDDETRERFDALGKSPGWKKAIANLDWTEAVATKTENYFKSPNWKTFVRESAERWEDVGELAAKEMEAGFRARGNLDGLEQEMENFQARVNATRERLAKQTTAEILQNEKDAKKELERLAKERLESEERGWALNNHMAKLAHDFKIKMAEDSARQQIELEEEIQRTIRETDRDVERTQRDLIEHGRLVEDSLFRAARAQHTLNREEEKRIKQRTVDIERLSKRTSNTFDKIEDGMGRVFGRGSRNNFLNLIGSMVRGLTKLVLLVPRVGLAITKHLATSFTEAGGGLKGTLMVAAQLAGGALLGLAATGPIVAGAFAAMSFVIGPFAALLSGLLGIVLALASSLAFGLVGALAPIVGLLGPIGIAAGAVALAFVGMDKAAKKATKETFEPMKEFFGGIGDAIRPGILEGFTNAWEGLSKKVGPDTENLLYRVTKMFEAAGEGVGNFIESFAHGIRGPGLGQFIGVMTRTLPETLDRLGGIFGNFVEGILGLFATLNREGGPVDSLLQGLDGKMQDFAKWSVSDEAGDFFEDAKESAKALGGFLDDVWYTTSLILSAGKDTGDSLFEKMGRQVRRFGDYLKENPDTLEDFFANAEETATNLGELAISLGEVFDELDNEDNRKNLQFFLDTLTKVYNAASDLGNEDFGKDKSWFANVMAGLRKANTSPDNILSGAWSSLEDAGFTKKIRDWVGLDEDGNPPGGWQKFLHLDKIDFGAIVPKIEVSDIIPDIQPGDIIPDITWGDVIPDIQASDIIPGNFESSVGSFFSGLFGGIDWGWIIPDISASDIIPDISWRDAIPSISWRDIIPDISWSDLIPDISWRDLIPKIGWNDLIPDLNWGALIPAMPSWGRWVRNIAWGALIPDLSWDDLIPNLSWGDFIPDIGWDDLIPDLSWDEIIPDITWDDFIPDIPTVHMNVDWPSPPGWWPLGKSGGGGGTVPVEEGGATGVTTLAAPLNTSTGGVPLAVSGGTRGRLRFAGQRGEQETAPGGKTVNVGGIVINSNSEDPEAVALATMNHLIAASY